MKTKTNHNLERATTDLKKAREKIKEANQTNEKKHADTPKSKKLNNIPKIN